MNNVLMSIGVIENNVYIFLDSQSMLSNLEEKDREIG